MQCVIQIYTMDVLETALRLKAPPKLLDVFICVQGKTGWFSFFLIHYSAQVLFSTAFIWFNSVMDKRKILT